MFLFALVSCTQRDDISYVISKANIKVDGKIEDWNAIQGIEVADTSKLWIGQGMVKENWKGKDDLSFIWKAAYSDSKMYFLFSVTDDNFLDSAQQQLSYLNDVIEIMIDPKNQKGDRYTLFDNRKKLNGYEMHFMPSKGNEVFIDDSLIPEYDLMYAQNDYYKNIWKGEIASMKREGGYVLELGFEVPGLEIKPGTEIGLDIDVCDDDGDGRKSLLIWSGENNQFWLTMDKYLTVVFE